jgi:D-glycero-beta-D-manno-heptose-7-phosphate kinase
MRRPQIGTAGNPDLEALLDRFAGARIVVAGDLVADEYIYGETERISREAPVLIVRYERSELKAGCAANATLSLCALGARVTPVGYVGDDEAGARLVELLRAAGADISLLQTARGEATATKTRILAGGKNTRRQQIVRLDRDGPSAPSAALAEQLSAAFRQAARGADAVLVSDYGLGTLPPLRADIARLCSAGTPVCVDARYDLRSYRGIALAKPNEVELEQAVGRRILDDLALLEKAGRELLVRLHARALLVTRGRSGMALLRPREQLALLPVHGAREAVDVTGAGDTVMAATTLGLAVGADALLSARLANVAGALVVQKPGTATVSAGELRAELRLTKVDEATLVSRPRPRGRA